MNIMTPYCGAMAASRAGPTGWSIGAGLCQQEQYSIQTTQICSIKLFIYFKYLQFKGYQSI
jgi:hypothetical protein